MGAEGGEDLSFLPWIVIILLVAKVFGALAEKFNQPPVLGELLGGILLGNLYLFGIEEVLHVRENPVIVGLSTIGVILLLFGAGLESNLGTMLRSGGRALLIALVGVVTPFVLGTLVVAPWIMPDSDANARLFLGATLTATSVGITARVFKDLGIMQRIEAVLVVGAAVIDDILGLLILTVVTAVVTTGSVEVSTIGVIVFKAIVFLTLAIVLGRTIAPYVNRAFSLIHPGVGMKMAIAVSFGLVFAILAKFAGLEPIVGAFAAGLVLDPVHFSEFHPPEIAERIHAWIRRHPINGEAGEQIHELIEEYNHRHVEDLIGQLNQFFVPFFFVLTGMGVDLTAFAQPSTLLIAAAITIVAFIGKLACGLVAPRGASRSIIGWGMAPRGEVGLIFAQIGAGLGVVSSANFSAIVIMVVVTTMISPIVLTQIVRRESR
ncbi:cation:proton antiporter [Candidatus Roizmanbacteria bacterium]|nr:cation:proton antiporter [Candidatus Roizmanbacteria bacterium]